MALTQAQRIEISSKIVQIPLQNKAADALKANLDAQKQKITDEDNANKSLMDDLTPLINGYQSELTQLDGNVRTELVEQDMIDGANKIKQNYFFPNDNQVPLSSVPDGVWKFLLPFSGSIAIGLNYTEQFPSTTTKEQDKIDAINAVITTIEGVIDPVRSTGLECQAGGSCSDSQYTDETTCTTNGETWTPGPDTYSPEPTIQQALTDIVAAINDWKTFLQNEKSLIITADPDSARQTQNDAAIADIDNTISVIDSWLTYDDWDTTTTLPSGTDGSGCDLYEALTADDFEPSKLRSYELQEIKDEIAARVSFITTRISQLESNLGSVGQDLSTGELNNTGSGLYDKRFGIINIRLNLLGGSLSKKNSLDKGQEAQDAQKATNDNTAAIYDSIMKVSLFRAPASGTGTIHVKDGSAFSTGDTVYVVADSQQELTGQIVNTDGNTIFLDFNIPEKYTHNNRSRLYKLL